MTKTEKKRRKICLQHQNVQPYRNTAPISTRQLPGLQYTGYKHTPGFLFSFFPLVDVFCLWWEGEKAAFHLPAHMLTFFFCGGAPAFCGGCFSKCSCASYHLGAEMAVGELSHEGELLRLGSLEKVLFHSFYGSHIVFQQPVNENHSQLAHIHTTRRISSQMLSMILLEIISV